MHATTVIYDADCGVCRWTADRLRAWDGRRERLRFVALQSDEAADLLADLDPAARTASWHAIDERGRRTSAGTAVPTVMRRLRFGAPFALIAESMPRTTERLYREMVRRRPQIARLIGTNACAVDPSRPR